MALAGWSGIKLEVIIEPDNIDEDLTNFPVNLLLSELSGPYQANLDFIFTEIGSDANRKKIAVAGPDDSTECFVEIEHWNTTNKQASLHVNVPFIDSTYGTRLYLYFDSGHADNTAYIGDTGDAAAKLVWNSGFKAVYHFAQDPSGGAPQLTDSTNNANHGTLQDAMTADRLITVSNKKAWYFTGQRVSLGTPLVINDWQDFTIEHYARPDVISGKNIWDTGRGAGNYLRSGYAGSNCNITGTNADGSYLLVSADAALVIDQELCCTMVRDSTTGINSIYSDSYPDGSVSNNVISFKTFDNSEGFLLGTSVNPYYGDLVEFRISDVARSEAWKKATFHSSNDNLIDYGFRSADTLVTLPLFTVSATTPTGNVNTALPRLSISAESFIHANANISLFIPTTDSIWGTLTEVSIPSLEVYSEGTPTQIFTVDIELPKLIFSLRPGISTSFDLPSFEASATGLHAFPFNGDIILPSIEALGYTGFGASISLKKPTFEITGLQGVVGNVDERLASLIIEAYLNAVQSGNVDAKLKKLLINAAATVGRSWSLDITIPELSIVLNAKFGTVANASIELPAINKTTMNAYNDIKASTSIILP